MWAIFAGAALLLAQATQSGPGSKGHEWCFDRGQDAQLCEATEAECNKLRAINTEIAQSVQTGRASGDPGLADRTAGIPEPGAADADSTIGPRLRCFMGRNAREHDPISKGRA